MQYTDVRAFKKPIYLIQSIGFCNKAIFFEPC